MLNYDCDCTIINIIIINIIICNLNISHKPI